MVIENDDIRSVSYF